MLERTKPISDRLRLIVAEPDLFCKTDLHYIEDAADLIDELTSRLATIEAVLREFRDADLEIVNMNVPTRNAFERLHCAEQSVDAVLGIVAQDDEQDCEETDEAPKPKPYRTRGRRG